HNISHSPTNKNSTTNGGSTLLTKLFPIACKKPGPLTGGEMPGAASPAGADDLASSCFTATVISLPGSLNLANPERDSGFFLTARKWLIEFIGVPTMEINRKIFRSHFENTCV